MTRIGVIRVSAFIRVTLLFLSGLTEPMGPAVYLKSEKQIPRFARDDMVRSG